MKEQEENEDERNSFLQAFVIYPERNEDIWNSGARRSKHIKTKARFYLLQPTMHN
jgi:hypothetical protein